MLKGEGFTPLVAAGDTVARGDPLIRFDLDAVALAATSLITPVIVTNAEAFAISRRTTGAAIGACEALMTLRSEEHTSELQSLMRISYAVFCLKKEKNSHQSSKTPPPDTWRNTRSTDNTT